MRELLAKKKALPKDVQRVTFNAITKDTVTKAMQHPRELDQDQIDAYLARRALDYLFGFTLSPVLWRKLPGAKSAGRCNRWRYGLSASANARSNCFVRRNTGRSSPAWNRAACPLRRGWSNSMAKSSSG